MASRTRHALVWTEDELAAYKSRQAMTATLKSLPPSKTTIPAAATKKASRPSSVKARASKTNSAPQSTSRSKSAISSVASLTGDAELQETLRSFLSSSAKPSKASKSTSKVNKAKAPLAKRRGMSTKPIKDSLVDPEIEVFANAKVFSVWFTGARAFTVNELIALYQYRKYETFGYKKLWQTLIQKAVSQAQTQGCVLPYFTHNTRLVLYRRGTRLVDLDSLPAMFKYAIDSFKKSHLIAEDNPNVITKLAPFQAQGEPVIALRLEQLAPSTKDLPDFASLWFSSKPLKLD